jgi:class 3 adenylate cyclase
MPLPSGTVTFLFTDIESSTKLWEDHTEAMQTALAHHDALLRQVITENNGYVFKTIGDAFCAAFYTAPEALAAAVAAQMALVGMTIVEGVGLRVRMVLHTGSAEARDEDYFGPSLNRVARLLLLGHGGQTLLSDVTHDLCRDSLPPGVSLKPMGEHRLRDLARPETVFQLLHPTLPAAFPPLRSLDNPTLPNNLPIQLTTFIGREKEITAVRSLLTTQRLLTLTGTGGCGKTRLSLQVAADVLDEFPDGVWFVELAPLFDPALVLQAVAQALGIKETAERPLTQTLTERLKTKQLLLTLDNCEHLLSACARLADVLLRQCSQIRILASSREPLGIAGEQTYRVPSLTQPVQNHTYTPEMLSRYEAVQLLIDRALLARPNFQVTKP